MMNVENTSSSFSELNVSEPRKIHIWEFPHEGFYIKLEPYIEKELIDCATGHVKGTKHLARILNKCRDMVYDYRHSRKFIPFLSLLKLCELTCDRFAIEQVEPHIVAYKGGPTAQPIRNPNLPLTETPALFAFMGHLMGDGGYDKCQACYTNTHEPLIRKFSGLLQSIFGNVPAREVFISRKPPFKDVFRIKFGLTIVRLLRHIYTVDFRTHTASVQRRLFELPKEYAASYIRAFGDDEGCVQDGYILLASTNKKLFQDIYELIQVKFPEIGKFMSVRMSIDRKNGRSTLYNIKLRPGTFARYRELIGLNHFEKRQEMDRILTSRAREWRQRTPFTTRRMLLKALRSRPMTAKDLARRLDITPKCIHIHLKGLRELGVVRPTTKVNKAQVFALTEKGHRLLGLPPLGLEILPGSGVQRDGVRKKLTVLKTLALAEEGITFTALKRQLGILEATIRNHLSKRWQRGRKTEQLGLLDLELVERSGRGGRTDPYIYRLTDSGKQVVKELEILFPNL